MRKVLLMLLLAFVSSGALAEWVKVGGNGDNTLYADPASIIKSSNMVKMRTLHDYKVAVKVAGAVYLSSEVQEEYDCKGNHSRTLFFSFHSRNMGKGKKVYSDTELHAWEPVRLGSVREILWKFACKKM
ncbi:MAG: hypothetical protein HY935_00885 [Nitrosomonadales bacterium]|nr:hypothetical protein [Nitrosomonadales bacterium]